MAQLYELRHKWWLSQTLMELPTSFVPVGATSKVLFMIRYCVAFLLPETLFSMGSGVDCLRDHWRTRLCKPPGQMRFDSVSR